MLGYLDFDEIAEKAYRHDPLPESCQLHELRCYEMLVIVYQQYSEGRIDINEAKDAKRRIKATYETDCVQYRMYKALADREKKINLSGIMRDIELSDCPYCKRLVKIMDGREQI